MKTRPAPKCYTVFVLVKSCISTTYIVSRPEFDVTELLTKVFSNEQVIVASRLDFLQFAPSESLVNEEQ